MATSDFLNLALRNRQYLPPELRARIDALAPDQTNNGVGLPTDAALPDSSAQDALATAKLQAAQSGVPGAQNATSLDELGQAQRAAPALATVRRPSLAAPAMPGFQSLATTAPSLDDDGSTPPADQSPAPGDAPGPLGAVAKLAMGAGLNPAVAQHVLSRQQPAPGQASAPDYLAAADRRQSLASVNNAGEQLAATLAHHKPDEAQLQRNVEGATAPVQAALAAQRANLEGSKAVIEGEKARRQLAADDPDSPESQTERQAFRAALPKLAEQMPLERMSATQIRDMYKNGFTGQKIADTEANQGTRNELLAKAQELRKRGFEVEAKKLELQADSLGLRKEQFGKKVAENQVAGIDYGSPYGAPTPKEAQATRGYKEALDNFDRVVGGMQSLLQKNGGQLGPTDAKLLYDQLRMRAVPLIGQMEQTGNLSRGHQHLIEQQLGGGLDSFTAWVNGGGMQKVLDSIRNEAHAGFDTKVRAQGGKMRAPSKVRVSNGKETYEIDPGDEAEASKDGFRRVGS